MNSPLITTSWGEMMMIELVIMEVRINGEGEGECFFTSKGRKLKGEGISCIHSGQGERIEKT